MSLKGQRKAFLFILLSWIYLSWNFPGNKVQGQPFEEDLLIDTVYGKVLGKRDADVNVFLGIPYAEAPIGKLRFRPTKPLRPWYPSIYKALEFAPECLQSNLFANSDELNRPKDEDCLYLNVWQPRKRLKSLLPVLIWVHGGAFIHGGSTKPEYDGKHLAEKGVIVVSFNYRLGALGFLVSISDGLYGNYGLDDQRAAFQWVQDNIVSFGGDPDRVTLFGESAGAMSIGLHLLHQQHHFQRYQEYRKQMETRAYKLYQEKIPTIRPQLNMSPPRKLFHAVIMQSNPFGYKYRTISIANFIGRAYKDLLDCEDLKCLQSESAEELLHVQDTLMAVPRSIGDFFTWGPVITDESYWREVRLRPSLLSNISVFQPMDAIRLLSNGINVPIVMGSNQHEGTVFVFTAFPTRMTKMLYQFLLFSFFRKSAWKIMKMYRPLTKRLEDSPYPDYRLVLSEIIGDYLFRCPNQYFASQLTGLGTAVFLYEFALPTRTPGFPCCDGLSCHTCELPYTFNQVEIIAADYSWSRDSEKGSSFSLQNQQGTEGRRVTFPDIFGVNSRPFGGSVPSTSLDSDIEVARLMADYWTTFATYGDPNGLLSVNSHGYLSSTRPKNAPWWPKLLGDLPSLQATKEMTALLDNRKRFVSEQATSNTDAAVKKDEEEPFQTPSTKTPVARGGLYGTKTQKSRLIAREMDNEVMTSRDFDSPLHARDLSSSNTAATTSGTTNAMDTVIDDLYLFEPSSISGFSATKNMHQMVFSHETEVTAIENDCVCNTWNLLEYRF